MFFRILVAGLVALVLPLAAAASAVVQSAKGTVEAAGAPLKPGQRIFPGTTVTTGGGAQAFLAFDDGMQIVLGENSLLRVIDFRFSPSGVTDRAVFELLRGSARVVTGKVAQNSPKQFFFRTPQTQLTVERPADFTVALVNPVYITVNTGTVISSNGWGNVPLSAGSTSAISGNAAAPAAISTSSLPASASSAMTNLAAASVTPVAGGASTGAGLGAATGTGFGVPAVAAAAAALGLGIAAANANSKSPVSHAPTP